MNAYKAGGAAPPAPPDVLTRNGKPAQFWFVDPRYNQSRKGVFPDSLFPASTMVFASGDTVIAQVDNPTAGLPPLAVARIATPFGFRHPYSRDHHDLPAVYSYVTTAAINAGEALRLVVREGPEFRNVSGNSNFLEALDGRDADSDSAQVAVKWMYPDRPPTKDTNATPPFGADWESAGGVQQAPNRAAKYDFIIPADATMVNLVLIYTDTVGSNFPRDAPAVLGAWTGTRGREGCWTFCGNVIPVPPTYPPNYRGPDPAECPGLTTVVRTFLAAQTDFTLERRHPAEPGVPSNNGNNLVGNTGYDLQP